MFTWYFKGIYLLCIAGYAKVFAQTLFFPGVQIGQEVIPLSFAKILSVGGVGPEGFTTYVEENINTLSQIFGGQATVSLETETATVAIGASGARLNVGGIVNSCTYGTDQQATCVNQVPGLPAATVTVPIVPVFTLDGGAQGAMPMVTPAPGVTGSSSGGNGAYGSNNGNTDSNKPNGGTRALSSSISASTTLALLLIAGFFIII